MKNDDWNIDNSILITMSNVKSITHSEKKNKSVKYNTLQHCLIELAHIVADHGDEYTPIFERIKLELEGDYKAQQTKVLINKITSSAPPQDLII